MMDELGPVAAYLPHRPPMLLIDTIVVATDTGAECRTTIRPDCVFLREGAVHSSAMIEYVAQACAIFAGVKAARRGDSPGRGFLVGCRAIDFAVDGFAVGDELTIAVTKVPGESQLAAFTGTVARAGVVCVTIQMSVLDAEPTGRPGASAGAGSEP